MIIGAASLGYNIFQGTKNASLKRKSLNDAIEVHVNVAQGLGAIQTAKEYLKVKEIELCEVGKTEGLLQALLSASAKNICNVRNASKENIDEMLANGQLKTQYSDLYFQFASIEKVGRFRKAIKWLKSLF